MKAASLNDALRASLRLCTVALTVDALSSTRVGTGFFVGPRMVLTCAHVIRGDNVNPSTVHGDLGWRTSCPDRLQTRMCTHSMTGEVWTWPLLRLSKDLADHPWVCLSSRCYFGDELWSFGYPNTDYRGGDPVSFRYIGDSQHKKRCQPEQGFLAARSSGGTVAPPRSNLSTGSVNRHYSHCPRHLLSGVEAVCAADTYLYSTRSFFRNCSSTKTLITVRSVTGFSF